MDAMMYLMGQAAARSDNIMLGVNKELAAGGLSVTPEEARQLTRQRLESLATTERVEFGVPAVVGIAEAMATSPYLKQEELLEVLSNLQEIFYELRADLAIDVPDAEILEALRKRFDACGGDAAEVASVPTEEIMSFSEDYRQALECENIATYRISDDEGRVHTFHPAQWDYDEQSCGWDGERWDDDWDN